MTDCSDLAADGKFRYESGLYFWEKKWKWLVLIQTKYFLKGDMKSVDC